MKGRSRKIFSARVRQHLPSLPEPRPSRALAASAEIRGIDHFPEATRRILVSVVRADVAGVLVPSPRPAKLARELRREIGNLCNVTQERGAVRVTVKLEADT